MSAPVVVVPGQVWSWETPNGDRRTMIVQRFADLMNCRRAFGIHPQSGRKMQVPLAWLLRGQKGARLERTIENYTYTPVR